MADSPVLGPGLACPGRDFMNGIVLGKDGAVNPGLERAVARSPGEAGRFHFPLPATSVALGHRPIARGDCARRAQVDPFAWRNRAKALELAPFVSVVL
jgi:hypothetical protein